MEKTILLYKPISVTPLQLIHKFREQYPTYKNMKIGYAGRLDPMAEGLLLLLIGDENKKRKVYEAFPKEYECEVLFGIETDTYDLLGKIISPIPNEIPDISARDINIFSERIEQILPSFLGQSEQPYPPYSSRPVKGKPLYYWARQNKLSGISIPTKKIEIFMIELLSQKTVDTKELGKIIFQRIEKVIGDFRQEEILKLWKDFLKTKPETIFPVFRFRISCSSGTYIRSFANNVGKKLNTSALALSITRTKIGDYDLQDSLKIDTL